LGKVWKTKLMEGGSTLLPCERPHASQNQKSKGEGEKLERADTKGKKNKEGQGAKTASSN